jgi:hypothetical protein
MNHTNCSVSVETQKMHFFTKDLVVRDIIHSSPWSSVTCARAQAKNRGKKRSHGTRTFHCMPSGPWQTNFDECRVISGT